MIRIDGPGRTSGVAGGQAARRGEAGRFALPGETLAPSRALSLGGATDVGALMMLQEVEDPLQRRRRSVKLGTALLDELDEMKLDLLAGRLSPARMSRLATLLADRAGSGDAGLEAVMDDIDLRVRVELAKNGHFPG